MENANQFAPNFHSKQRQNDFHYLCSPKRRESMFKWSQAPMGSKAGDQAKGNRPDLKEGIEHGEKHKNGGTAI